MNSIGIAYADLENFFASAGTFDAAIVQFRDAAAAGQFWAGWKAMLHRCQSSVLKGMTTGAEKVAGLPTLTVEGGDKYEANVNEVNVIDGARLIVVCEKTYGHGKSPFTKGLPRAVTMEIVKVLHPG